MTEVVTREPTRSRTLRVPHAAVSVPRTRRTLVEDLRSRDVPLLVVEEAEIVVAELLGNSVRHAAALPDGMVRVHWQVKGGVVELDVTDGGGGTAPKPVHPSIYSTSGRGLRIVRSLAHEWGVLDEDRGRTVWVCLGGPSRRRRP
jgi:serine/threonine-protein kinase RsbW